MFGKAKDLSARMLAAKDITDEKSAYRKGEAQLPAPYIFIYDVSAGGKAQLDDLARAVNILAEEGYTFVSHSMGVNNGQVIIMRKDGST